MKKKASQCDECKFYTTDPRQHLCKAANFPRFYLPTFRNSGGWKRVCEDFKPKGSK